MTFCVVSMELMLKSLSSSHAPYLLHFLHSGVRSSTFLASPLLSGNLGSCVMLLKKIKYIPSWVKNIHLFKDWVFYKSWRAANFHDFSLSVKSTGQSLIEGRVGVVQDSGTRVQGDTLREGAQPRQINARGADIISNLYSQQLVTSGSIFQKLPWVFQVLVYRRHRRARNRIRSPLRPPHTRGVTGLWGRRWRWKSSQGSRLSRESRTWKMEI